MDLNRLNPRIAGARLRQVQDAQKMQAVVTERLTKKGLSMPPYEFLELIGKGAYGRVYKSKNRETQEECAVKIIEVDSQDYYAGLEAKDETIKDFMHETSILQTLKDNKAQNVNKIFGAFSVDTQLWIVSEYCPGGSLNTLMKARSPPGLSEDFIIPVAREVAIALKYVHNAGIVHRDIKCANILVTEDGRIQLCDFGISGVLENQVSKRTTIIGTPHWMAPELVTHIGTDFRGVSYGAEIDCWAFGCAVFEMATGHPPNSRVRAEMLGTTLSVRAPRLEANKYPQGLCDFTAFCLEQRPDARPNASQIMEHPYIANTYEQYPTKGICRLIEHFSLWEQEGGQRSSLFNPLGAAGPDDMEESGVEEDWNFSTTSAFDQRMSIRFDENFAIPGIVSSERQLMGFEKIVEEQRSNRGGAVLGRLFDSSAKPYSYSDGRRGSDLPLREFQESSAGDRTTMIDIDISMPTIDDIPNLSLIDPPTLRARRRELRDSDSENDDAPFQTARRATQDWKMELLVEPPADDNPNRRTQDWTFPKMIPDTSNERTPPAIMQTAVRSSSTLQPIDNKMLNRRTQDWKFPSAEEMKVAASTAHHSISLTSPDASFDMPRPSLRHAATMPTSSTYPTSSSPASPNRTSLIDLDEALEIEIPDFTGPSTSHSATDSAVTDMSRGDPFDLEEELELSKESSRQSLHMKSQSEPTTNFLEQKGAQDDADLDATMHNRSSSMNQSDCTDRERATSRPAGIQPARYRQRGPTNLQKHIAGRQGYQFSSDSTIPSSRGGSIDSTGSAPTHSYNLSFGASDEEARREESRMWQSVKARHRRQKTSDGASTIASNASRSDNEGITMKPAARPSRMAGTWRPHHQSNGHIVPFEPDRRMLLPEPTHEHALREFSRLWCNLHAMNLQGGDVMEKEYGSNVEGLQLQAEFGARQMLVNKLMEDDDGVRSSDVSTLRGSGFDI